jgi:hypothetical protein
MLGKIMAVPTLDKLPLSENAYFTFISPDLLTLLFDS